MKRRLTLVGSILGICISMLLLLIGVSSLKNLIKEISSSQIIEISLVFSSVMLLFAILAVVFNLILVLICNNHIELDGKQKRCTICAMIFNFLLSIFCFVLPRLGIDSFSSIIYIIFMLFLIFSTILILVDFVKQINR